MRMVDIIAAKRDGRALTDEEIRFFVRGYTADEIPDYQAAALLMAVCLRGLEPREVATLTMEMAGSGEVVDLSSIPGVKVDKHSTGGVGDKTTLILGPIVASLGVPVAKMSGRALGHSGGTVDKLESIPGYRTALERQEFLDTVRRVGISIAGQSGNLAPADKKMYALRDVTATVESIGLIAASVMSKKIAAGADAIVLDVKMGSGAFLKTLEDARELAREMVQIGESVGRSTVALITNMDIPLGQAIGNSLEVIEAVETLQGRGPQDLTDLCVELSASMLGLAGQGTLEQCREKSRGSIADGSAFQKLLDLVEAQGGDISWLQDTEKFPKATIRHEVTASADGYITFMDCQGIGTASMLLGAGRETKQDKIDYAAGILLHRKTGEHVRKGEVLATLLTSSKEKLRDGQKRLEQSIVLEQQAPQPKPHIYARIDRTSIA